MRIPPTLTLAAGPVLGAIALRALGATLRVRREEAAVAPLWAARAPVIYAVWHDRLLLLPYLYGHRGSRVLASRSRDGELVARWIRRFGLEPVRGSSTRGGGEALRLLTRALRSGHEVVVVPDGPKGPREVLKPGVIALARLTGAPIVPMALGASREWRLRSWDEFRIPKPFARCVMRFGEPIYVARHRAGEEAARKEVEAALRGLGWQVDEEARR
ncbi:MAG TPA: lysophospholipid acyltransferase family protein [Candidatus Deferrimicrobiaceae bacterium]|nr:lysophospholipid acyltransferase family protein [Candidatus Deferrimicrobiaceae bacterium]